MKNIKWLPFLVLLFFLPVRTGAQESELRGVWLTNVASAIMNSKSNMATAMDSLQAWGINAVFPALYNDGYTLYPSLVLESATGNTIHPAYQGRDVLAEIIAEAHRHGIEVHAWLEYGFMASFGASGGPLISSNPGWAGKRYNKDTAESDDNFFWLSQANPEVQDFLIALGVELIQNYDVDGVQLDRVRYGNTLDANKNVIASDFGYDAAHVDRYKSEHAGQDPPAPTDAGYKLWRSQILDEFQLAFYQALKAENPQVLVSNAPIVYPYGYTNFMQKWPNWITQGSVDFVCTQLYRYNLNAYRNELVTVLNSQVPAGYKNFFPGMLIRDGSYQAPASLVTSFVNENRTRNVEGGIFWFYEGMPAIAVELKSSLFQTAARPPYRDGIWRPAATIVEESDTLAEKIGSWTSRIGAGATGYYGYNQSVLTAGGGSGARISYHARIQAAAYYDVYFHQPYNAQLTNSLPIKLLDGSEVIKRINETDNTGRGWKFLESMYMEEGVQSVVEIDAAGVPAGQTIAADAVMLILNRKLSPDVIISNVVREKVPAVPRRSVLYQNYPNPFNPSTTIKFYNPRNSWIILKVYNLSGQQVANLYEGYHTAGMHQFQFRTGDLATGVYIYSLRIGQEKFSRKMLLVR